jgi:hypothetical protein
VTFAGRPSAGSKGALRRAAALAATVGKIWAIGPASEGLEPLLSS